MAGWFRRKRRTADPGAVLSSADTVWSDEIVPQIKAAQENRLRRLVGQHEVVAAVEALLFEADPIGINFDDNTDEYRAEAETIVIRLPEARSADDLRRIVHEEFVRWFDAKLAGPEDRYRQVAQAIWDQYGQRPELNP